MPRGWLAVGLLGALLASAAWAGPTGQAMGDRPGQALRPPPMAPPAAGPTQSAALVGEARKPPKPTGVVTTDDVQTCTQYGGFGLGLACKDLFPQGGLAVVWDFHPGADVVTGFRIYAINAGKRYLLGTQANGPNVRGWVLGKAPILSYAGTCFAVTSFDSAAESDLSASYCVPAAAAPQTVNLTPTNQRTSWQDSDSNKPGFSAAGVASGPLTVGYNYTTSKTQFIVESDASENQIYRAGLLFNLPPMDHQTLKSAVLRLSVDSAWDWTGAIDETLPTPGRVTDHFNSCTAHIAVGVDRWWTYPQWIADAKVLSPGPAMGPDVAIDVTPIVAGWLSGQPNFGFVLEGDEENLNAFTEKGCVTSYVPSSAVLVLQLG